VSAARVRRGAHAYPCADAPRARVRAPSLAQTASARTGLRGVLAKVAEADALRALRRRGEEDSPNVDLQARAAAATADRPRAFARARTLFR
jgi:hypothetical protein